MALDYVQYECPRCGNVTVVPFKELPVESPLCIHGTHKVVMLLAGFVKTEDPVPSREKHTLL